MDYIKLKNDIVCWLRNYVYSAHKKGITFGLSGGIDSSVLALIAKEAFDRDILPVIMPINSNIEDEKDAMLLIDKFDLRYKKLDLSSVYSRLINLYGECENNLAKANLKSRLRMMTLYFYAQENDLLVAGATNKSEFMIGYFTKYGDSGVDILPLAELYKEDIYELAKVLKIPYKIINKPPSAGLWEGQTDFEELGFSYEQLDGFLKSGTGTSDFKDLIDKKISISDHKRKFPEIYKFEV